jgi:hypothetical protein
MNIGFPRLQQGNVSVGAKRDISIILLGLMTDKIERILDTELRKGIRKGVK